MLIKKVNHNTVDVFLENGWEFWGRFKIKYGKEFNQVFQVSGTRFPRAVIGHLEKMYNNNYHHANNKVGV